MGPGTGTGTEAEAEAEQLASSAVPTSTDHVAENFEQPVVLIAVDLNGA